MVYCLVAGWWCTNYVAIRLHIWVGWRSPALFYASVTSAGCVHLVNEYLAAGVAAFHFRVACNHEVFEKYDEDFYKDFLDAYASAREARKEKEAGRSRWKRQRDEPDDDDQI